MPGNTFWAYGQSDQAERISAGVEAGYIRGVQSGVMTDVDTVELPGDVWGGSAAITGAFPWIPSPRALEILSDSANDTAAGTGMQSAMVVYLDANYLQQVIVVALNGVTPVALPVCAHVQLVLVFAAGSVGTNVGNLTVRDAGAGPMRNFVAAGQGNSQQAVMMTPAGYTYMLKQITMSLQTNAGAARTATIMLWFREFGRGYYQVLPIELNNSQPVTLNFDPPIPLREKAQMAVRVVAASSDNGNVSASLSGYFRANGVN